MFKMQFLDIGLALRHCVGREREKEGDGEGKVRRGGGEPGGEKQYVKWLLGWLPGVASIRPQSLSRLHIIWLHTHWLHTVLHEGKCQRFQ